MAYADALAYLKKENYSLLADWIEKTVGSPVTCKDIVSVNKDLKDGANRDRPSLVQGALLIWIASGRPKGKDGWGTETQTKQRFTEMTEQELRAYLKANNYAESAPATNTVAVQVSSQPVQVPVQPAQSRLQTGPQLPRPAQANVTQRPNLPGPPVQNRGLPNQASPHTHRPIVNQGSPSAPGLGLGGLPTTPPRSASPPKFAPAKPKSATAPPSTTPFTVQKADTLMKAIEKMGDLKSLFICDIPIGAALYLTESTTSGLTDNAKIALGNKVPENWIKTGKGVIYHGMGKCFSCAAAVIYKLVGDSQFDKVRIESVGASGYDHHFVVINRDPKTDVLNISTWNAEAVMVDAWQANMFEWEKTAPSTVKKNAQLCYTRANFPYKKSEVVFFCAFEPADRSTHRALVEEVNPKPHQAIKPAWEAMKKCYVDHWQKQKKVDGCTVAGWCSVKTPLPPKPKANATH